ncbi:class I SAM-dependent methyltransferase [Methanobacterium ferruginis]|uniref:class I SAM-dependent methyltransferase n=1 Tax=Methanobacterium ferruginis TaxID=710191 RepID=UPI002573A6F9|nr:class I SAM-dependent methyltransferase [Methanobacterium ferruginis]BDZ69139.1 hypothetical protein GCM10025860_25870 [Methanobacterium ferruginis]
MEKSEINFLHKFPKVKTELGRINFILERCNNKKVLHLGCVDEGLTVERIKNRSLLHLQLKEIAKEVWGVDISEDGIKTLKNQGITNLIVGDIEHIDQISELQKHNFDVILLTEVLEHLNNPGLFLKAVKNLFNQNTIMIITVPNGIRFTGLGYALRGYEFVHPDHNYWFSYRTLCALLNKNQYQIEELRVYSFYDHTVSIPKKIYKGIKKIVVKKKLLTLRNL